MRRHLNSEVVWKSDRVHLSDLAVTVGYDENLLQAFSGHAETGKTV